MFIAILRIKKGQGEFHPAQWNLNQVSSGTCSGAMGLDSNGAKMTTCASITALY
jgi:hypothetical protein